MIEGRRIVIGVTGGIAAYKTCDLVRRCVKAGAEVRVAMTPHAKEFVTPLTFETLTHNPVISDSFDRANTPATHHIDTARWAEIIFVAPATANIIAKAAHGLADDYLSTLILATEAPVVFAPAMNPTMWKAAATQRNCVMLRELGHTILETGYGQMAEPEVGQGRMLEPVQLFDRLVANLPKQGPLAGRRVIVTGGPTPEPIDPVRVITNRSSGKMGVALSEVATGLGAETVFIHGPIGVELPAGAHCVPVESVEEMHQAVTIHLPDADALVMAAAVADFRPAHTSEQKIKKHDADTSIELTSTIDILTEVSKVKAQQVIVGFALETDAEKADQHARDRVVRKDLDLQALNVIGEPGVGFGTDTNRVTLYRRDGSTEELPLESKRDVARRIWDAAIEIMNERRHNA
jgi:phosphopantothenoylcysteine decarboxylase / phosphopantothenate---cysteine ligase